MPTKEEIEAATNAVQRANADFIPNWALATIMARAALAAAEVVRHAVRQQAQRDAHAAMNAAMTEAYDATLTALTRQGGT